MSGSVIDLRQISKSYGATEVLHEIDLRIDAGEMLAIVGPSGSGKSTVLNIMGTLDRPTTGSLSIAGHSVDDLSDDGLAELRAVHIGFVFQLFHLAAGATAVENVADGLLYSGVPRAERRTRAIAALDRVGLSHRLAHRPPMLSGGEKQRVAIARAVVRNPSVLLADEPTGALDTASGANVLDILRGLNAEGTTVVMITHDRELASSLPRSVGMLDGRVSAVRRETSGARR